MTEQRPPESSVDRLRQEFEKLIDTVWSQGERAADAFGLRSMPKGWLPTVDVIETADNILVIVDLPGVDPALVEIVLVGNMLTVRGERPLSAWGEKDLMLRNERCAGPFTRSVPLPVTVDPARVSAVALHGVFTITLARVEPPRPAEVRVPVTTQSAPVPAADPVG